MASLAKTPQTLAALVDVLATDTEGEGIFSIEERLPDPFDILTICSSLLSVNPENDIGRSGEDNTPVVQLAHFSV